MRRTSAPTCAPRERARRSSRRRTTYTVRPPSGRLARAPSSGTRSVLGSAMNEPPCSAPAVTICCQSSAGPETAITVLPDSTAHASTPPASHQCLRNGGSASLWPSASRRCRVGRSASARAVAWASSPMRLRSSRAVVAASCTRALPCWSARSCSMPLAYQAMPPPTNSTSASWIAVSHQPSPVRAGSGRRAVNHCTRVRSMTLAPPVAGALHERLHEQRERGEQGEERGDRERADEVVLVVEDLDVQRHGVGEPADVPRDHRDRAELAHGARVAEHHAVHQAPAHLGQRDAEEGHPAAGAERDGRLLLVVPQLLHQRDELA